VWACGAAGSAPGWHSGGHRFDPGQVHQPSLAYGELRLASQASQSHAKVARHSAKGATVGYSLMNELRLASQRRDGGLTPSPNELRLHPAFFVECHCVRVAGMPPNINTLPSWASTTAW
jgi:hypothetical protein